MEPLKEPLDLMLDVHVHFVPADLLNVLLLIALGDWDIAAIRYQIHCLGLAEIINVNTKIKSQGRNVVFKNPSQVFKVLRVDVLHIIDR